MPRAPRRAGPGAVCAVLGGLMATACASTGAVPRPFPMPAGPARRSGPSLARPAASTPSGDDNASAREPLPSPEGFTLVGLALSLRGVPYRNGGSDPSGFDCSGFTQYVFARYGVTLPREVREQFQMGDEIQPQDIEPGDLLFFSTVAPGASHVGLAIGDGQFVHAPSSNGVVRVEDVNLSYWSSRLVGVRRVDEMSQ